MSIIEIAKRDNAMDVALEELDTGMAQALDESMATGDAPIPASEPATQQENASPADGKENAPPATAQASEAPAAVAAGAPAAGEPSTAPEKPEEPEAARKLTAHTQSRLAALGSFDKLYRDAQTRLQEIDTKLSEVVTQQQLTRRFFNILQTDIYRANELELSNVGLAAEHKKLTEQLGDTSRKLQEREALIEGLRQREAHLAHDNETLRSALGAARLQLVEAASLNAQNEAKLGEAVKALSVQTVEAERSACENEALREKQVALSIDIEKALKREAEAQRKLDELTTTHDKEAAQHAELLATLSKSEKEALRLQMALESAQLKQAEMAEAALIVETDREAEAERNAAEVQGLRSEIQVLQSKLDADANERSAAAEEIAKLKAELSDALAEKQIADEKLLALMQENEAVQQDLSIASANISELALQQETEQIKLDIHRQECEDLRAEIAVLNTRIKDLLPYERLYKVTKARQRNGGNVIADVVPATAAKPRRRSVSHGRSSAA